MAHIESEFVRHTACENCGSSDAKSEYSDGHTYCFVCHTRTSGNEEKHHNHEMSTNVQLKGSAVRLQRRGLSNRRARNIRSSETENFYATIITQVTEYFREQK